jgi:hypothetical protein
MGKLINSTGYIDSMKNIVDGYNTRLENPYYKFTREKGTIVTYYHIDKNASSLDENLKIPDDDLGENSPLRYNKILGYVLHGLDAIQLQLEYDETGLVTEAIQGSCTKVFSDGLVPYPNDFFKIDYVQGSILFRIISTTPDTLENGANMWRLDYELSKTTDATIELQTINTFNFVFENVGTESNPFIRDADYTVIADLDKQIDDLYVIYRNLFFNDRVESFTTDDGLYDEYLIEFMIRNEIRFDKPYLALVQRTLPERKFNLNYNRSIFKSLEEPTGNLYKTIRVIKSEIRDIMSIFTSRQEIYYRMLYSEPEPKLPNMNYEYLEVFDEIFYNNIEQQIFYAPDRLENIIIKYFNDLGLTQADLQLIKNTDYYDGNVKNYYLIPIIIFILTNYGKNLMGKEIAKIT